MIQKADITLNLESAIINSSDAVRDLVVLLESELTERPHLDIFDVLLPTETPTTNYVVSPSEKLCGLVSAFIIS